VDVPQTRYAKAPDGVHLAYQVFGEGPTDVVAIPGGFTHVEMRWEEPQTARLWRRIARFCRVIVFDKRGAGLSDRATKLPPFEDQIDDVLAVMAAAGSESAVVDGILDGGILAALFAATHPDRVRGLILESSTPRVLKAPDYPWGFDADAWESLAKQIDEWSLDDLIALTSPDRVGDQPYREWFGRYARAGAGPGGLAAIMRLVAGVDIRSVLPMIRVPTLVLARPNDALVSIEGSRYLADAIPGAVLRVLPESDPSYIPMAGDTTPSIGEIEEFITGVRAAPEPDRVLATVLFTDIVGSTERAATLGDARWRQLLDRHDDVARRVLADHAGRLVKSTGDGLLATFDGPARAVRAACALRSALAAADIAIRAGLHAGEIEVRGDDVGGIAVHIAARVEGHAQPGEILVSRTVTDLVVGSGLEFDDRGERDLKGVPGTWRLFAVE
jgi:class 3 adenylate cyclase/pimeloyl-ACP methyl ester carboxylesterase